jgi:hypothetical protein
MVAVTVSRHNAQPQLTSFGAEGRSSYIQKMILVRLDDGQELVRYICQLDKRGSS